MRNNPARLGWVILLTSFIVFCLLAVSIPLGVRWYLLHSQIKQSGLVSVTSGTVLLLPSTDSNPIAVVDARSVEPGTLIKTDQRSQAALSFHAAGGNGQGGPEIATVQIYPAANVLLSHASRPRFAVELRSCPVRHRRGQRPRARLRRRKCSPMARISP